MGSNSDKSSQKKKSKESIRSLGKTPRKKLKEESFRAKEKINLNKTLFVRKTQKNIMNISMANDAINPNKVGMRNLEIDLESSRILEQEGELLPYPEHQVKSPEASENKESSQKASPNTPGRHVSEISNFWLFASRNQKKRLRYQLAYRNTNCLMFPDDPFVVFWVWIRSL